MIRLFFKKEDFMNIDNKRINDFMLKCGFSKKDADHFWEIIKPIVEHDEFKRRMTNEFLHHDDVTLGEHIIMDAILTYQNALKYAIVDDSVDVDLAVVIAMFHDLYTMHWQNNPDIICNHFFNKHGFVHPVEAAINAMIWYPDYFKDSTQAFKITDGIIHHMYPFPVRTFDGSDLELNNLDNFNKLSEREKNLVILSTNRARIGKVSFARSLFVEGRIMSHADKVISWGSELKSVHGLTACVTGHNRNLDKKAKE
jgi:hypothetical protein